MAVSRPVKSEHAKNDEVIVVDLSFVKDGSVTSEVIQGNLSLNDMAISEIKLKLDSIPGKVAYWKSKAADVTHIIEQVQQKFDLWYAKVYAKYDDTKMTESAKKNKVILENEEEWDKQQTRLSRLNHQQAKIMALVKGYETMAWTLTTLASLARAELATLNPEPVGRGELS